MPNTYPLPTPITGSFTGETYGILLGSLEDRTFHSVSQVGSERELMVFGGLTRESQEQEIQGVSKKPSRVES